MGKPKQYTNGIMLDIAHKALLPGSKASVAHNEGLDESLVQHRVRNINELAESVGESTLWIWKQDALIKPQHQPKVCWHLVQWLENTVESLSLKAGEISAHLHEYSKNHNIFTVNEAANLKTLQSSKTWSFNWLANNNFTAKQLHGEAGDVDQEAVAPEIGHSE
jgi:hypothetical protein